MAIAGGPEIESNWWPYGGSVGESENDRCCVYLCRGYIKGVGSHRTYGKVLQGWIDIFLPSATFGTAEKGVEKVY